jgi:uncharacterized lipoprotein YehR (DUF1307 family)
MGMLQNKTGVKRVKTIRSLLACLVLALSLTACGKDGSKQQKAQSSEQPQSSSIVDQELHKQAQIYQEILQHQKKQEDKLKKDTNERYKMLEEQSKKPQQTDGQTAEKK